MTHRAPSTLALTMAATLALAAPAMAQQSQSHLFEVTKNHVLKVCIYPGYYAIAYRDPATGKLAGIDIDLSQELGKSLDAQVQYVETSFGTFIADLQANKCDIGMFGVGVTLKRAQAVEFTTPYLQTGIYAVVRKGGGITSWADIDKPGHTVAVTLGSYIEPFMKDYLKNAKVVSVAPPATREQELMARRVDAEIVDYPTAQKVTADFDWALDARAAGQAAGDAICICGLPGRPDLAQLPQPFRGHDQAGRPRWRRRPSATTSARSWRRNRMGTYHFRWDVVWSNLPFLLSGLEQTLLISALTLAASVVLGMVLALADMSRVWPVRFLGSAVGEVVRNTPILVQLLWVYYVLPIVFDISIDAFSACIIGLSVYSSAFIAEIYRAGIQSVPRGHREAAQVLGISPLDAFIRIVIPQALRATLPPLAANFVQLIKYSSLAAVISVSEVTRRGMELSASTFRPMEIFSFIAVVYFLICWPLSQGIRFWERHLAAR